MGYGDSLLASGERIVRRAHQHWFMLAWNARYSVLAIVLGLIGIVIKLLNGSDTGPLFTILGYIVLALFVLGILWFLWGLLRFQNEEYIITSRRIIHAEGVINKKATDSSLEKINDAILSESLFGRMFGFGDLDVLTASESGIERLRMLKDAKSFKKAMLEAKHELEIEITRPTMPPMRAEYPVEQPAPAPAPAPAPVDPSGSMSADEISGALEKLGAMRDKALITPEEYDAKKQDLLDRL
ncbi:MAG: PH domain-containing protein [Chloroflexota bacterium]